MPYGTACGRLKKSILFKLVQKLKKDVCYRCHKKIEDEKDLSIDHKKAWLNVDVKLFWDLENIAFSHNECNSKSRKTFGPPPFKGPEGTLRCSVCQFFRPVENFGKQNKKHVKRKFRYICNDCRKKKGWEHQNRK